MSTKIGAKVGLKRNPMCWFDFKIEREKLQRSVLNCNVSLNSLKVAFLIVLSCFMSVNTFLGDIQPGSQELSNLRARPGHKNPHCISSPPETQFQQRATDLCLISFTCWNSKGIKAKKVAESTLGFGCTESKSRAGREARGWTPRSGRCLTHLRPLNKSCDASLRLIM